MNQVRILIFAKAPIPGRVKTRLIPALGAAGAARLARRLLRHTLTQAMAADLGSVELCACPTFSHPDWAGQRLSLGISEGSESRDSGIVTTRKAWTSRPAKDAAVFSEPLFLACGMADRLETSDQGEGDLGARLARAARRHLDLGRRVLMIGADCPSLSAQRLREAAAALNDHEAALIPARDGGYVLLGLRTFHPSLFADLPWSTARVASLTLARIQAMDWRAWVGNELVDIDEPADLGDLPEELGQGWLGHTEQASWP